MFGFFIPEPDPAVGDIYVYKEAPEAGYIKITQTKINSTEETVYWLTTEEGIELGWHSKEYIKKTFNKIPDPYLKVKEYCKQYGWIWKGK